VAFLISLKAGGFGLTLTEADYVYVLDPWWNPAAEAQAIDRAHRIGQNRPVTVYRLVSAGTIEEKVVTLQERKRDLFQRVVDEGGSLSGAITADDVRDLLGLA
jgi:SNF2 family DNA or RNA helicase